MEFSRQEHWSGLPFPPPEHLLNPEIESASLALACGFCHHYFHSGKKKKNSFSIMDFSVASFSFKCARMKVLTTYLSEFTFIMTKSLKCQFLKLMTKQKTQSVDCPRGWNRGFRATAEKPAVEKRTENFLQYRRERRITTNVMKQCLFINPNELSAAGIQFISTLALSCSLISIGDERNHL